jgi:hypothetical protein
MKELYIARHSHRFGEDIYLAKCDRYPTTEEVVNTFGIDFEPDREEVIEITRSHTDEIKEIV